jgi:carbon-monoxide dehydrogenase medium subunit
MLNLRLVRPELLVDISQLDGLRRIEEADGFWRIGCAVTHAQLEDAGAMLRSVPMLVEVAAEIAYRSVRNRGTIGGSLAHADPAADWPLALAVLGARIQLRNRNGQAREVAADRFMRGAFTTELQPGEIIERIDVPKQSPSGTHGYFKFCRKAGDFPEASAAVVLERDPDRSRIYLGALDGPPQSLPELARGVTARGPDAATEETISAAVSAAVPALDPVDVSMHAAAVSRAIQQALSRWR